MKTIDAWQLGGTLFVPASHKHLERILKGEKFPALRSVVVDFEDGLSPREHEAALQRAGKWIEALQPSSLLRFIRPRDTDQLTTLLQMPGIEKVDGFVLPKFGLENAEAYLSLLCKEAFAFMPSIEGKELFDEGSLAALRTMLSDLQQRIPAVRFGAEDMFRQLGLRRECEQSLYEMAAPSKVIGTLLGVFRPYGFEIAAPVFRCYRDHAAFMADAARDLREGLVSKTIIHPDQIALIESVYRVDPQEYEEAVRLADSQEAVFTQAGSMAETLTQSPWAHRLLRRHALYGLRER
jgi:citrate lyase beta subunit